MAENDKFETLGDAYAKYPQSTLVMRKQYVDEKDAIIADLQKTNATIANNAVTMNRKIDWHANSKCGEPNHYPEQVETEKGHEVKKMIDVLFKQFQKELDKAPDYVKENTMCYFWHNTSACTKCPKKDCKAMEPRKIEPNKPHKLIDVFNKMKSCPYHEDWHYCCRCNFGYICKWSDNKIKEVLKKYIKENWGK